MSTQKGKTNHPVLYPLNYYTTLPLKAFRGEPAITEIDKLFTPNHSSSHAIALAMSSGLHASFDNASP